MRILCVHAHYDDFEFVAAGTFWLWKKHLGSQLRMRVLICTDGQAGHHCQTREETGRRRLEEQRASARIGGYEFEPLRLPDGRIPREGCLDSTVDFLAALWKAIRDFEPDYLFCPPLPADPLAGLHLDHVAVAEAVRKVAYMINVPHAYTPEYPADETVSRPCTVPVIVQVHDSYLQESNTHDLAVDVEEAFAKICEMSFCHQSQIMEWLPWVGRHDLSPPGSLAEWTEMMRARFRQKNRALGIPTGSACEVFTFTAWGAIPSYEKLLRDIPNLLPVGSHLDRLRQRLARWAGE